MPIDHTSLPVSDLAASTDFYLKILKPLNYGLFMKLENVVGLTVPRHSPDFWITGPATPQEKAESTKVPQVHIAFKGTSKGMVNEFHANALKAGATCNGPPGVRAQYHKGYYAAYVLDLDGNNIECVYFQVWWITALQMAPSVIGGAGIAALAWWAGRAGWAL